MKKAKPHFSGATLEQPSDLALTTASTAEVVVKAIPEAELAKHAIPLHLHPLRVLPAHFTEAIERAYAPATRFWLHVDAERFVAELQNQNAAYMSALVQSWEQWGCGSFHEDLVNSILTKKFDEYCAAWLLSLPQGQVSNDDDEVYELLHNHLKGAGELTHLRYLELDGVKAVRYIRDRMTSLAS
ncbi:hypothetical protein [Paraburkholderia sp. 32]|uniref:hypothetical protein n=1 Tax=Paraburkholderia sp. 32 TaxID=2991057 RepID=UPI003D1FC7D8